MSDQTDPTDAERASQDPADPADPDTPDLDAATEAAVAAALAEARHDAPMPAEVAQRLEATIGGLAAERDPEGVVIALDPAARARRLRVRLLLGAAAAVVVGAVVVGAVDGRAGSSDTQAATSLAEDAPSRDTAAAGDAAAPDLASPQAGADAGGAAGESSTPAPDPLLRSETSPLVVQRVDSDAPLREVRPDRLREDLVSLQLVSIPDPAAADYSGTRLLAPPDFVCGPTGFGQGLLIGIDYAGRSAVVVFRAPVGSTQEADVIACGTGDVLHSTTLSSVG